MRKRLLDSEKFAEISLKSNPLVLSASVGVQVRESFMRQYLEEEQEDEDGMAKVRGVGGPEDSTISFRKRRPIKLLTLLSHPRNADYEKKKRGVANIIWWVSLPYF